MTTMARPDGPLGPLADEFLARRQRGESPSIEEFAEEHPELANQIRELFPRLLTLQEHDPRLQNYVETLGASEGHATLLRGVPDKLGDYRIVREIGRGGMGIVYEAVEESLNRRVALKVLPSQVVLDSKTLQRFQREAKAAARLHHTNIVPVYGVGHDQNVHYFVMQYIRGKGLDRVIEEMRAATVAASSGESTAALGPPAGAAAPSWAARATAELPPAASAKTGVTGNLDETTAMPVPAPAARPTTAPRQGGQAAAVGTSTDAGAGLTVAVRRSEIAAALQASSPEHPPPPPSERLYWQNVARIGRQVADALDYAHAQGTVHRDIKPSNLMLDEQGIVWVTDFGLAKGAEHDNLTQTGDVLGTLRYMAPEALQGDADARSDLYALGLTLYELAALSPARDAVQRHDLIRQVTTGETSRLRKLAPDVPRDLETIIHKAIDPEPRRRYATAGDLADDLLRFINDEPIRARRTTSIERLWRWTRRNPVVAGLSAALLAVLVVVAAVSVVAAVRFQFLAAQNRALADRAQQLADQEKSSRVAAERAAQESEAVVKFLIEDMIESSQPQRSRGRDVTVRDVLSIAGTRVGTAFKEQPLQEAAVRRAIGQAYVALGRYEEAHAQLAAALAIRERELGETSAATLLVLRDLSGCLNSQGQYAEAQPQLEKCLAEQRARLGDNDLETLITMGNLAVNLGYQNKYAEARQLSDAQLATLRRQFGPEHPETLTALHTQAWLLELQGRFAEAVELNRQVLEARRRVLGAEHPSTIETLSNLASALDRQGRYAEAETLYQELLDVNRRVLGPQHPATLIALRALAVNRLSRGKLAEGQAMVEQALAEQRKSLGPEHPDTLATSVLLAAILERQGKLTEAQALYEQVLEAQRRVLGPQHVDTLLSLDSLAGCLARQGKFDEARALAEETLKQAREVLGPDDPDTLRITSGIALVFFRQEQYDDAERLYREVVESSRRTLGPDHPDTLLAQASLAACISQSGDPAGAAPLYEETYRALVRVLGREHPRTLDAMDGWAAALAARGEIDRAVELRRQLVTTAREELGPEHAVTATALQSLAAMLQDAGRHAEAVPLLRELLAVRRKTCAADDPILASALAMLGWALTEEGSPVEAEPVLRECLSIRMAALGPEHALTANTQSLLGDCLAQQEKFAEAETLLIAGYEAMRARGDVLPKRVEQAAERIAELYARWGKTDKRTQWQAVLDGLRKPAALPKSGTPPTPADAPSPANSPASPPLPPPPSPGAAAPAEG